MKLSEAIRLGAMMKPQGFGELAVNGTATCAMGAAFNAISKHIRDFDGDAEFDLVVKEQEWVTPPNQCPVCGETFDRVDDTGAEDGFFVITMCLNDKHHWTREQIADWVEVIEQADERRAIATTVRDAKRAVTPSVSG